MESRSIINPTLLHPSGDYPNRFIRLPYRFLTETLDNRSDELTACEAFIQMIANVRYQDTDETVKGDTHTCRRGESYRSLQAWSTIFRWNKQKTRRYFIKLRDNGLLEMENQVNTTRIRIIHYDYYVGGASINITNTYSASFEVFWKTYHDVTQVRAVDKLPTFQYWRKMNKVEQEKSVKVIGRYFYGLAKSTYCVTAHTFLKNKKFNDQIYY